MDVYGKRDAGNLGKHGEFMSIKESPKAAAELNANGDGRGRLDRPSARKTDCPEGCLTLALEKPCPHGWGSAGYTLYMEEARKRHSAP